MQIRYQKEIEKLEKQNKELKTQLLLKGGNQTLSSAKLRKIKVWIYFPGFLNRKSQRKLLDREMAPTNAKKTVFNSSVF